MKERPDEVVDEDGYTVLPNGYRVKVTVVEKPSLAVMRKVNEIIIRAERRNSAKPTA